LEESVQREEQLLLMTVAGLEASLDNHMPKGVGRDFYRWAISKENPYQGEYLQAQGITQLVKMTCKLLNGLVSDALWEKLAPYTVPMNVYQIYEIVSDNLAIGLASATSFTAEREQRRTILQEFNRSMIARLNGDRRSGDQLLKKIKPLARGVSLFEQSLNSRKQSFFAHVYSEYHRDVKPEDLEAAIFPILVANIESCVDLANFMCDYESGSLILKGLINRYRAVNRLLKHQPLPPQDLLDASTYAILVIPTLAYYIAILGEVIQPQEGFKTVVRNNLLAKALYDAALMVRLLNDLGTWTLQLPPEQYMALSTVLELRYRHYSNSANFIDGLQTAIEDTQVLTRIHKDIVHGEFNVSLYGIRDSSFDSDAIVAFNQNLGYFAQVYQGASQRLQRSLGAIDEQLNHNWLSSLILRFVQFHEVLYSNPYDMKDGEYSI
jgi:hypothetical protein